MNAISIVNLIVTILQSTEGVIRNIFSAFGALNKAEPYIALGFVGLSYTKKASHYLDSPDHLKHLLTQSPSQLWRMSKNFEMENKLIREAQLARLEVDRD